MKIYQFSMALTYSLHCRDLIKRRWGDLRRLSVTSLRLSTKVIGVLATIISGIALSFILKLLTLPKRNESYCYLNARYVIRPASRLLLRILNVRLILRGEIPDHNTLIVANHWGYIDSLILMSLSPCLVLSNTNIRNIKVIGKIMAMMGFMFVDRKKNASIPRLITKGTALFQRTPLNLAFFPEGHAGEGVEIQPFHSSFFQVAIDASAPVQPLAIFLESVNGETASERNRHFLALHSRRISLFRHIFHFLTVKSMAVEVVTLDLIAASTIKKHGLTRKEISQICEIGISTAFNERLQAGE